MRTGRLRRQPPCAAALELQGAHARALTSSGEGFLLAGDSSAAVAAMPFATQPRMLFATPTPPAGDVCAQARPNHAQG